MGILMFCLYEQGNYTRVLGSKKLLYVTASLLLTSVPRLSSREQPMLYTSQQQPVPILSDDAENRVPLLDAEHSWSLLHTCLHVKFCHAHFLLYNVFIKTLTWCRYRHKIIKYLNACELLWDEESKVISVCNYLYIVMLATQINIRSQAP
jgi:hypothetical protein